jgi:hypothetical protein
MNTPLLGILMVLGSLGLTALGAVVIVYARLKHMPVPVKPLVVVGGAWTALYVVALAASSLTSHERVLPINHDKQFCGFYIDCHMQVAVQRVDTMRAVGTTGREIRAGGVFYVLTLRVSSTAVAARLRLLDPDIVVRDATGREFLRSAVAESLLAASGAPVVPLTQEIGPGEQFLTTVAFDIPADAPAPRLSVTEGIWADKLIELFLIGDEDSILHKRTAFELAS